VSGTFSEGTFYFTTNWVLFSLLYYAALSDSSLTIE